MRLAYHVLTASLGLVFLIAAIGKVRHPLVFVHVVRNYQILPEVVAIWVALLLITLESLLAVAFLTGWLITVAIPTAAAMLLGFAGAVGINLHRNRPVACGCFGDPQERISGRTVTRLALLQGGVFLVGLITIRLGGGDNLALLPARSGGGYALEVATLAVATNLLVMWALALPELRLAVWHIASAKAGENEPSSAPSI